MVTKMNIKDIGWIYHAPPKPSENLEINVPPTSQIPGLGNMPDECFPSEMERLKKNLFKETDTPYIMLAKQGGRTDLLVMPETETKSSSAVDYPRCDWFYLEDNRLLDEHTRNKDVTYGLPDYMVHDEYRPKANEDKVTHCNGKESRTRLSRAPFAQETSRPMDGSRQSPIKIAEPRPDGYGIRAEKFKEKQMKHQSGQGKTDLEIQAKERAKLRHPEPVSLSRLLANGYAVDTTGQREKTEKDYQKERREKMAICTEYSEMYESSVPHVTTKKMAAKKQPCSSNRVGNLTVSKNMKTQS